MDYPMKSFDSNNGIVVMEHDAGEFEVEILRDELSPTVEYGNVSL